MRDVRASLIARVKVGIHNPTEKWLRKDCVIDTVALFL